ncbi:MAG: hypothetical protein AAGF91_16265, partial [Actinomycetota bacterium]
SCFPVAMQSLSVPPDPDPNSGGLHLKVTRHAAAEAQHLRMVAGPGVVPLVAERPGELLLAPARCSIADVVASRGRLPTDQTRGVVLAAARALARVHADDLVHGDVKPANLLLHDDGLWLADFETAGAPGSRRRRHSPARPGGPSLTAADDVRALVHTAIECATGVVVDPTVAWSALDLVRLGCRADLAAELALAWRRATDVDQLVAIVDPSDARLPTPTPPFGADATPTVDVNLDDWW